MSGDSFLKEIGRSYLVSAFLPSSLFVTLGYFLFRGFIPNKIATLISKNNPASWGEWVFLFVIIMWVAFYLFSASDITVKLFEGYLLPKFIKNKMGECLKRKWFRNFAPNFQQYKNFSPEVDFMDESDLEKHQTDDIQENTELDDSNWDVVQEEGGKLFQLAFQELQTLEIRGPLDKENILPTRLGNVLRASEIYASERYWIEEITVWPRLVPVLPKNLAQSLEEKNNHMMFMLNSSFLVYCVATLCFLFGISWLPCYLFSGLGICRSLSQKAGFFYIGYDYISPLMYILLGVCFTGFGYILYRIGVNAAEGIGLFIRASFDLFRMQLLQQLNLTPPKNLAEERDLWMELSTFFVAGDRLGDVRFPDYQYSFIKKESPSKDKLNNDS